MWIPKESLLQGQEILDWVDVGLKKTDIWVRIRPDKQKGKNHVEQADRKAIIKTSAVVFDGRCVA